MKTYSTKSAAIKAARTECQKIFGKSYSAYEGPDFIIHPVTERDENYFPVYRWKFQIVVAA